MQSFRFHILGVPHTVADDEYCSCAFTQKVVKFCKMMVSRGHTVIHYGHARSKVECTEHVTVTDDAILQKTYGTYDWKAVQFKHSRDDYAHAIYNLNAKYALADRVRPGDFVLCFWGWGNQAAIQGLREGVKVVEPGIGYPDTFAQYKVFESYAHMHTVYGKLKQSPQWYDVIIPNYFDTSEFEFTADKEDYYLCLSRKIGCKGIHIAAQVCEHIHARLVVAGQGNIRDIFPDGIPSCVTDVGFADKPQRRQLLSKAKALFLPTSYAEPFGGTVIEALLSGTPAITTDWGAFPEINPHGVTGYRCRTFDHFVWAATHLEAIKSVTCRSWAEQYSLENIAPRYEEYFQTLADLDRPKKWYELHPERSQASWLA